MSYTPMYEIQGSDIQVHTTNNTHLQPRTDASLPQGRHG